MKGVLVIIFLFVPAINQLIASDGNRLQDTFDEIHTIRQSIQKTSASFLLLAKQLDVAEKNGSQTAMVIKPGAAVMDSDLATANSIHVLMSGDELPVLATRGEWHQVRLRDQRPGWVHGDDVQLSGSRPDAAQRSSGANSANQQKARLMAENLYEQLNKQAEAAGQLITEFEEQYKNLSSGGQQEIADLYERFSDEKEKITISRAYANHYYRKLEPYRSAPVSATANTPVGFNGTLSTRIGSSAFESASELSETTRNINLAGSLILNPKSRVTLNLNHNNDVVQTPYTNSHVNLGFSHNTTTGTRMRGSFNYQNYGDKTSQRNNFNNLGAGLNVEHPLNAVTKIYGDFQANSKSFVEEGSNDYTGGQFHTSLISQGKKTGVDLGVRGRVQSSDISFLDYTRIIPNLKFTFFTNTGSVSLAAEGEQLVYAQEAEGNNFNRGRVDLEWAGGGESTRISAIAKQFPNNETFDNIKFRIQNQKSISSGGGFGRRSMYVQYVYHPNVDGLLTNYFDVRFDRNHSGQSGYFDFNLYGRVWEETERDHTLDIFSRFGFNFSNIQIGPVVGARLLVNPDDFEIERNGNSLRFGVDGRGNFMIKNVSVYSSIRYQKSIVYNSEISIDTQTGLVTEGDIQSRMPTTIQISAGLQTPLIDFLDLQVDLSYYNIDLDISREISINPVNTRSGLRFMAGIQYRFNRQQFRR